MSIYWNWLDLQQVELPRLHKRPKPLIENIRAVGFSTQSGKPLRHETRMQARQPADCHTVEVVNGSCRDHDLHRHSAIHRFFRSAAGVNFNVVIATGFVICLETPRNIRYAGFSIGPLQQIHQLSAERLRTVNSLPAKCDVTEKILSALVNWNDDVNLVTLVLKVLMRLINQSVQKTFRHIKPLDEARSLLHVGGYKRQCFLEAGISLARRPDHVIEEFVRRLPSVSMEDDRVQHESRTFSNIQPQPARRFDHVMYIHFRVAVFSIENFQKKGQVVRASRTQSKILDCGDLFFQGRA